MVTTNIHIDHVEGRIYRLTECGQKVDCSGWLEKSNGYMRFSYMNKKCYKHRVIWEHAHGAVPEGMQVDHCNGDKLDNRILNLRLVTASQNQQNQHGPKRGSTSGHKGIDWRRDYGKWRVRITIDRDSIHVGTFSDLDDAVKAYREAAAAHHTHNPEAMA